MAVSSKADRPFGVVVALLCAVVVGCASIGYFADSTAGKVATLEVRMTDIPNAFWVFENGTDCSGELKIFSKASTAGFVAGTAKPLIIEANREMALYVDGRFSSPLRYCELTVSFLPEASGQYRVQFSKDTTDGPVCRLRVTRLLDEGGTIREVPEPSFKRRVARIGATTTHQECVSL